MELIAPSCGWASCLEEPIADLESWFFVLRIVERRDVEVVLIVELVLPFAADSKECKANTLTEVQRLEPKLPDRLFVDADEQLLVEPAQPGSLEGPVLVDDVENSVAV